MCRSTAKSDGSNVQELTKGFDPTFSPDGRTIAFTPGQSGREQVYTMSVEGSNVIRLTNPPGGSQHPAFSHDGSKIAFMSTRDGSAQVYVMNSDGSNVTRLTGPPGESRYPVFSP